MKKILSTFLLMYCLNSFGQSTSNNGKPDIYLDAKRIELDSYFFDPNTIEKVDVVKQTPNKTINASNQIFITSKYPNKFNFLSYSVIKNKYFNEDNKPVLLLINGNFIKDPRSINIDESYIYKVEVESGEDFEELKHLYPTLKIVNIKLKNYNFKNKERSIMLDGIDPKINPE